MNSDRLRQLEEQKALILKHLDWLNAEIDKETVSKKPSSSPKTSRLLETFEHDRPVSRSIKIPDPESTGSAAIASDLYDQLGPDTKSAAADTKRGCLLVGGLAFCILGALISYIYFFY